MSQSLKSNIVADGPIRFMTTEEYQTRRRELHRTIAARYAPLLAGAGFFRRLYLHYLRHLEFGRELGKITPSRHSRPTVLLAAKTYGSVFYDELTPLDSSAGSGGCPIRNHMAISAHGYLPTHCNGPL